MHSVESILQTRSTQSEGEISQLGGAYQSVQAENLSRKGGDHTDYQQILEQAKALVDARKPQASEQKRAAFANSVAYLVTGMSSGYGGPSVREHAACHRFGPGGGDRSFDEAVELLIRDDGPVFGPITEFHYQIWLSEHCFDDDPEDVKMLQSWERRN